MNGRVIVEGPPWGFRAVLSRPHDGDSLWVVCDTGFSSRYEPELRLLDVHAPELSQPGGRETTAYVNGWLTANTVPGRRWPLWVEIRQTRTFEPVMRMTFTRYVGTVWPFDKAGPGGVDPVWADSLNASVVTFLSGHPEWPSGE